MGVELPLRRDGLTIRPVGGDVVVLDQEGRVHAVSSVAAQVLSLSDGRTDAHDIAAALSAADAPAPRAEVSRAIGELRDAGLLVSPDRLDRRRVLRHAATAGALGVTTMMVSSVVVPGVAAAQSPGGGGDNGGGGNGGGDPVTQEVDIGGSAFATGTAAPYHWTFALTAYGPEELDEENQLVYPTIAQWLAGRPKDLDALGIPPELHSNFDPLQLLTTDDPNPPVSFTDVEFIRTDGGPASTLTAASVSLSAAPFVLSISGISFTSGGFTSLSPSSVSLSAVSSPSSTFAGIWVVPQGDWVSGTLG